MNSNPPPSQASDASGKKVRKPYTITKSRESWTDEEHDKFLEALQLFDRDWKKIEDFVGSKTVIQIRSHAQKYFLKVQKNGTVAHVPPPRPKRKASHPYPQKAPKNGWFLYDKKKNISDPEVCISRVLNSLLSFLFLVVLVPLQASLTYQSYSVNSIASGYPTWEEASMLVNNATAGSMPSENEYSYLEVEADIGSKGVASVSNCSMNAFGNSPRAAPSSELTKQGKQGSAGHGIPDFSEVYGFIGSVFDPESKDHVQKLKEMDPINFETVLLLMRNLTLNLSSPEFEPIKEVLSSYEVQAKAVEVSPE